MNIWNINLCFFPNKSYMYNNANEIKHTRNKMVCTILFLVMAVVYLGLASGGSKWMGRSCQWCNLYPFQTGLKTRNVLRRTFRVHPRPLSVWKVAGWSPPGEHGTNSGWTRREIRARPSSTNTERPEEDVPCLPQTAASMKGLGMHTVCKPEPEIPEWTY